MILQLMKDYEAHSNRRLQRNANGDLCPTLQLMADLSEICRDARRLGVQLIFCGDFNEKWSDNGTFHQWATAESLVNILENDAVTGGATTCFPNNADPSDIDWVLCTSALNDKGLIKAGVLHEANIKSAHCPIFVSIKALAWLNIRNAEVARYKQHKYKQNYIIGKSDSKRIQTYQKLLCKIGINFVSII